MITMAGTCWKQAYLIRGQKNSPLDCDLEPSLFRGGWECLTKNFKPAERVISNLKLRYSWGQVGNDGASSLAVPDRIHRKRGWGELRLPGTDLSIHL